jgi:uncharacterized repeat protein (TIGR03803 family)
MRAKAILVCAFLFCAALNVRATTYKTLYTFNNSDGFTPFAGVIFDRAGNLNGVTPWGDIEGEGNEGSIFRLTPSQGGWKFGELHVFDLQDTEAAEPIGGLAADEAGNLYGTGTYVHGGSGACSSLFEFSASGEFSVLHYFYDVDGCDPEAALTYSNGVLWGTTKGGGSTGQGTVFTMDTSGGSFQSFSFTGKKGSQPLSPFTLWGYGTSFAGGGKGQGNIYKLDAVQGFMNKYSFKADGKAGYAPMGDLLTLEVGGVRTIYGITTMGGIGGGGAIYRLTEVHPNSDKWRIKVLHSFSPDDGQGWAPLAGLIADSAGNLYGTTSRGGEGGWDCGTVFKLSPGRSANQWTHTILYSFNADNWDGCYPAAGVALDSDGNLYGTTQYGGEYWDGTVYEITP